MRISFKRVWPSDLNFCTYSTKTVWYQIWYSDLSTHAMRNVYMCRSYAEESERKQLVHVTVVKITSLCWHVLKQGIQYKSNHSNQPILAVFILTRQVLLCWGVHRLIWYILQVPSCGCVAAPLVPPAGCLPNPPAIVLHASLGWKLTWMAQNYPNFKWKMHENRYSSRKSRVFRCHDRFAGFHQSPMPMHRNFQDDNIFGLIDSESAHGCNVHVDRLLQ